ncbi:hypothetical protein FA13DRAFT_1712384 [Coprinellus micaceus]|uniref:Uncharacterized protein n=1 Tax=Coprinellus micaceus TaxID=71717 RepID=A0A4Y7T150_COPMI|nr:hypothetical protein FA13DRAFT_1712384 [Coprinellus micaceus]
MGMTFKEIIASVSKFQCACFNIHGFLDFNIIYKNWSDSRVWWVNPNLMGTFTEDFDTADKLHRRGIPVWFLRPSFCILPNMNVGAHHPFDPLDCVINDFAQDGVLDPSPSFEPARLHVGLNLASPSSVAQNATEIIIKGNVSVDVAPTSVRHAPCCRSPVHLPVLVCVKLCSPGGLVNVVVTRPAEKNCEPI